MGSDFDIGQFDYRVRINLPVRISRIDVAAGTFHGHRIDVGGAAAAREISVTLRPARKQSKFARPDAARIGRGMSPGGILRLDGAEEVSPGQWTADWPTILTQSDRDDQACLLGPLRVLPFRPPEAPGDHVRLGLELILRKTAYSLTEAYQRHTMVPGETAQDFIMAALHRCIGIPNSQRPWGVPMAWILVSSGGEHRSLSIVQRFDTGGAVPVAGHEDEYLRPDRRRWLAAALDAGDLADVSIVEGRMFFMGRDAILGLSEKQRLPDQWYRLPKAQLKPGEPQDATGFTPSSVSIRRRPSGSWYFVDVLPLRAQPSIETAEAVLAQACLREPAAAAGTGAAAARGDAA